MGLFIGLLYLQARLTYLCTRVVVCLCYYSFQSPLTPVGISNLNGALFYLVCELTYSTLFGILTFLPADYPLVVREYHDGIYSVFRYIVILRHFICNGLHYYCFQLLLCAFNVVCSVIHCGWPSYVAHFVLVGWILKLN